MASVEALSEALSDWGETNGAIVVISHDRAFCEKVGFTHVGTVTDGKLIVEQRNARDGDWDSSASSMQPTLALGSSTLGNGLQGSSSSSSSSSSTNGNGNGMDRKLQKQAFNAPKRIAKIEEWVLAKEAKISAIDNEMLSIGNDVGKLVDLSKEKEKLQSEVSKLMEEWEELEELLSQVAV